MQTPTDNQLQTSKVNLPFKVAGQPASLATYLASLPVSAPEREVLAKKYCTPPFRSLSVNIINTSTKYDENTTRYYVNNTKMPIMKTRFKVPVQDGEPIRCILMQFPGNRREIYCAIPDIEKFLQRQYSHPEAMATGLLEEWESIEDADIVGLHYYSLSVLPWLIPLKPGKAPIRDRMVRLIRIACKRADGL